MGEHVVVAEEDSARDGDLPVAPSVLVGALHPGSDVLVDDGLVHLRVEDVKPAVRAATSSPERRHLPQNVPGVSLPIPSLTEKDVVDLDFALGLGVDYVAQSFVRSRADVAAPREARAGRLGGRG